MKPIKNVLRHPVASPTQNMLNAFFLPEDQDAFAQSQGYADAQQMCYYEDREHTEVPPMTDNEVEQMIERNACPDDIARAMGYESAQAITDELNRMEREEAERHAQYVTPPPVNLLQLAKVDSREVYTDEDCISLHSLSNELTGVY